MKILFLSSLYSTPRLPDRSPGNARILHAMRPHAEVRVIAPVPFYPAALVRRRPALRALAEAPAFERDDDGSTVLHPRTVHIPFIGRRLYAGLFAASLLRVLRREVESFHPDVLLSAWAYPDGTAAVGLARWLGLPCVVRAMGGDINNFAQKPGLRGQIAWAMRRAARVIAVSPALAGALADLGVPPDRVVTIPTGIDPARFFPQDRVTARARLGLHGTCVLVPARLSPEKGLDVLVEALARLERGDVTVVLVGGGAERSRLRERAAALGVGEQLRFEGFQPEAMMPLYYAAADLVCLPSRQEGWPDALMESAACGCPFVASNVGGVPEIVALSDGGLLVPADDPDALAGAIRAALDRAWDRAAIARRMETHTLDATARRYVETCAAVAGGTGPD